MRYILCAILISVLFLGCQSKSINQKEPVVSTEAQVQLSKVVQPEPVVLPKLPLLKHRIIEKQDISYENTPRLVYRIILDVDTIPSDAEVLYTSKYLWENGNKGMKEFTVFSYLPTMKTDLPAYGVGEFNQNGLVRFSTNENALSGTKWELKKPVVEDIPVASAKEYSIDISAVNETGRIVKVKILTNFPNGTILRLSIGRSHYLKGIKDEYSGDLFEEDIVVLNGGYETVALINDAKWYNEYQRLSASLPNDFPPISKISETIEIVVLYTPAKQQTENVVKILGAKGEYVTGKGAEKFGTGTAGSLTLFRSTKELVMPFKK